MRSSIERTSGRPSGWLQEGAHIERVILEQDLKRDYQVFLQEPNRGRRRQRRTARQRSRRGPALGRGARPAFRRWARPVPRLPDRVSVARRPARHRERRGPDAALSRRTRQRKGPGRLYAIPRKRRACRWAHRARQPVRSGTRRGAPAMTFADRMPAVVRIRFHRATGALSGHRDAALGRLSRPPVLRLCAYRIRGGGGQSVQGPRVATIRHAADAARTVAPACFTFITSRSTPRLANPTIAFGARRPWLELSSA